MRLFLSLLLAILTLFSLLPPAAAQETLQVTVTQVDNSAYPAVTLYVRVEDGRGNLVTDLPQERFTITEDGTAVALTAFTPSVQGGVRTVLTIDRSSSMAEENKMEGAKAAAIAYIEQLRAQDQAAVVSFDERTDVVQPFTTDQTLLTSRVRRLRLGDCTAIYDGLYESAELIDVESGRRIVIFITDGIDCREIPEVSDRGSRHSLAEAVERAEETEVPVHVIGLGDRSTTDIRRGIDEEVLRHIADSTGGNYYYAPTAADLENLYRSLAVETQQEYVLSYQSPRPTYDGTRRDIQVSVNSDSGSAASASAEYLEAHLLNIHSDLRVGLLWLIPLLALLVGPTLWQRWQPAVPPPLPTPSNQWPPPIQPAAACPHCHAPIRPGAKFCAACGRSTTVAAAPPRPQLTHCPSCGNEVRPGANFCSRCRAALN
jgi:VWFA-related protein